jgi:hypothetical protein
VRHIQRYEGRLALLLMLILPIIFVYYSTVHMLSPSLTFENSRKEDAPVDVAIVTTPTQQLLTWILLGLLLAWMLAFTLLALRPDEKRRVRPQELVDSTGPLPATAAPFHMLATQSARKTEHNALPVAHVQPRVRPNNLEVGQRGTAHIAR